MLSIHVILTEQDLGTLLGALQGAPWPQTAAEQDVGRKLEGAQAILDVEAARAAQPARAAAASAEVAQ